MITKLYYWFWHNFLRLPKPISWIIVDSIKEHLLVWQIVCAILSAVSTTLILHFIAMK